MLYYGNSKIKLNKKVDDVCFCEQNKQEWDLIKVAIFYLFYSFFTSFHVNENYTMLVYIKNPQVNNVQIMSFL